MAQWCAAATRVPAAQFVAPDTSRLNPCPLGTRALEQVSPEWHGWLHYTHDKTGPVMVAEFEKPFKMAHKINQSMQRPEFTEEFDFRVPQTKIDNSGFHQPPGSIGQRIARGRVGPK